MPVFAAALEHDMPGRVAPADHRPVIALRAIAAELEGHAPRFQQRRDLVEQAHLVPGPHLAGAGVCLGDVEAGGVLFEGVGRRCHSAEAV